MTSTSQPAAGALRDSPATTHAAGAAAEQGAPADRAARLFDLQLTFNLFPASYAHPSWIERLGISMGLPSGSRDPTAQPTSPSSPFWVRRLSAALLRDGQLDQQFDCDFSDSGKRLALLDASSLLRLGGLVAALMLRDRLRRIVARDEVRSLQQIIGAEAHHFALRATEDSRGLSLQAGQWGSQMPDAEGWAARSANLIAAAIPGTAVGVLGRLQLKFPYGWSRTAAQRLRLTPTQRAGLAALFLAVVAQQCREWAWLFEPAGFHSHGETEH